MNTNSKILILGGGFAGARVAQDLARAGFASVTLVDKKDYFEVSYAMLRLLVGDSSLDERARMRYEEFLEADFVQGNVVTLEERSAILENGDRLDFDCAVVATGSAYDTFSIAKSRKAMTLTARHEETAQAQMQLQDADSVLIVGGGAVGTELAGEIAYKYPKKSVKLVEGGPRLLGELSPKASEVARRQLQDLGVEIMCNTMLQEGDDTLQGADVVYRCLGLRPNTGLMQQHFAQCLDQQGRLRVDAHLRVEGLQHIYAIGDCANVPEGKLGYMADKQGAAVAANIIRSAKDKKLKPYKPNPQMALVPVGPKSGLVQLPFAVTTLKMMVNMKQKDMFVTKQFNNMGVKR